MYTEAEQTMAESKALLDVDQGELRNSGYVKLPVITPGMVKVEFGFSAPHAIYLHEGTGPAVGRPVFMPPLDALRGWASRHGIPEDALFALAKSIGQKGLRPRKFLTKAMNRRRQGMNARIAARVRKSLMAKNAAR